MRKPFKPALLLAAFIAAALVSLNAFAQTANTDARQLEMEQLQAQVDVMLEEVNALQSYRICAEKGKIYDPEQTTRADTDGCVLPSTLPPPQTDAAEKRRAPAAGNTQARQNATTNKPIAATAKTFTLPSASEFDGDVPLNRVESAPRASEALRQQELTRQSASNPPAESGDDILSGLEEPDYPNDKVRRLIQSAVDQALSGNKLRPEALDEAYAKARDEQSGAAQPTQEAANPPAEPTQAELKAAHKSAVQNLVPNCREGEFLTTVDGRVVCQRAASAGKMACAPSTLRVYLGWVERHIHFHVGYTPHGQETSAAEDAHEINVLCENGDYKLQTVTRKECGGRHCHPSVKPSYSITYYCNKDATGRCYAKQNGNLVNHLFTEARLSKQY